MTEDIYSQLQPTKYCRRQFINDIKLLRQRQKELSNQENIYNNYFEKKPRKKRNMINIVKLPDTNNKRGIYQKNKNITQEYLEKKRLQNKSRIENIQNKSLDNNRYRKKAPSKLDIKPKNDISINDISIKIKTPKKVKNSSPRKKKIVINKTKNNHSKFKKIKTRKRLKNRIVSPMYFKRYNITNNNIIPNNVKNDKIIPNNKPNNPKPSNNETRSQNKHLNKKKRLLNRNKFKSKKIYIKKPSNSIDINNIKNKLDKLPYSILVNILHKENLVKKNTRAPKKLLIELLLATKIDCISITRDYI